MCVGVMSFDVTLRDVTSRSAFDMKTRKSSWRKFFC